MEELFEVETTDVGEPCADRPADEALVERLAQRGWAVWDDFLPEGQWRALREESRAAWDGGNFRRAGVGRGANLTVREDLRRDHVLWLREGEMTPMQEGWLERLEQLRRTLNERLFLGLFEYEGHFAVYPPGAFYKAHLDRHQQTQDRVVTVILYLNEEWVEADGGALRLWTTPGAREGPEERIVPLGNRLVCFLSGDYWHEVLPARRERMSITGWFRLRQL